MGLPPSFVDDFTPYEFGLYQRGWVKQQTNQWEHTRFISWWVQRVQLTEPLKLEEVMPLPSDEERIKAERKAQKRAQQAKPALVMSQKEIDKLNKIFG